MATFFGEILATSSRAFLDDDDDNSDENVEENIGDKCNFAVSWQVELGDASKTSSETFLVIYGNVAKAFADQYLLQGAKIAGKVEKTLPSTSDDKKSLHSKKIGGGNIYILPSGITACIVSDLADDEAAPFVDCITEMLRGARSQVLVITSVPLVQFRSPVVLLGDSDGFLRSLATQNPPPPELKIKCPSLEVPNLIAGLPAGVLTLCQCLGIKARLIACFSDESCGMIDSRTFAPFMPLLSCPPLSLLSHASDKATHQPLLTEHSGNMYL